MKPLVTEEQIARYHNDGVVLIRNLFDSHWLEVLANGIEENLRSPSQRTLDYVNNPQEKARFFYDARTLGEVSDYDRFMLDSPMAEALTHLMGSSQAILFYISVFVRTVGTRNRTPWHQDQPSWSALGHHACSAWTSLDRVPKETALEFVKGSHRWETKFQRSPFFNVTYEKDDPTTHPVFPDIEAHRDDYEILSWEMEPGDCVVFHGMTARGGSGGLPPGLGRRAVSVQSLGDDARFRLLPGGDDPAISANLLNLGLKPGDPFECDICPVAFSRG